MDVHVYPMGDLFEHQTQRDCWCRPEIKEVAKDGYVIIHNAIDNRFNPEHADIPMTPN